jgi:hypothetical protein
MEFQLSQFLIEGYLSSDAQFQQNFTTITDFVNHIDTPPEAPKEGWKQICLLAKSALRNFSFLDVPIQQQVFHIAQRLTEQNTALCFDQPTLEFYRNIIQVWAHFSYLEIAITQVSLFLTPARFSHPLSEQELNLAQCLIAFAIKHFQWLAGSNQIKIKHLSYLVTIPPLPELLEAPQLPRYQFLVRILQNCPPLSAPPSSPLPAPPLPDLQRAPPSSPLPAPPLPDLQRAPPSVAPLLSTAASPSNGFFRRLVASSPPSLEEGYVFVPTTFSEEEQRTFKAQMERETKEREEIQTAQLQKICRLGHDICQHYFPLSWLGLDFQQQQFIQHFDQRFPPVAKQLFFSPPSRVTLLQFQILYQSLTHGVRFLQVVRKEQERSLQFSQNELHQLLASILERFFLRWQPEQSPINAFVSLITVNSSLQLIERLMTPDSFYFILDRLLSSDPWDFEDFERKKIPWAVFITDDEVTNQLGEVLEALGRELIALGEPQGAANVVTKLLLGIVNLKKYEFAKKIQQILHQIKSSPCTMSPLVVIYQILFHKETGTEGGDKLFATWFHWQQMEPGKKAACKEALQNKLNDHLYQIILKEVQEQSQVGGWALKKTSSIQTFCTTLSQRLWQLFQKEENIKLFLFYLLQGIEKAFLIESEKSSTPSK